MTSIKLSDIAESRVNNLNLMRFIAAVFVQEGWSVDELEAAIHEVEHRLYPRVIQAIAEGRMHVEAGRVHVEPSAR